jgi:LPPG:FO 2-phospho-L-lactate transferase
MRPDKAGKAVMNGSVVALAGGVGGAKLVLGLADVLPPERLTVIGNTGDDVVRHGLWISPDLDILTYTLAGVIDTEKGWGYRDESFRVLETLRALGEETWMNLGDRDLATHLFRTERRAAGMRSTEIVGELARRLGVRVRLLPPTDQDIQTRLKTPLGWLDFQSFYIREQCRPEVEEIVYAGSETAVATLEAVQAIEAASLLIFAPSNPIASIGPILAVPGIREAIQRCRGRRVAVAPLIGGACLKGPTLKMMVAQGFAPDLGGVAAFYRGLIDAFWVDSRDASWKASLEQTGLSVSLSELLLNTRDQKTTLAQRLCFSDGQACDRQSPPSILQQDGPIERD